MKEKSNRKKQGITAFLAQRFASDSAWGGGATVVLHGCRNAIVYGCRRIVYYSPGEICLEVGERRVSVCGAGLYCASFTGGTVRVEGLLTGVVYRNAREEERA